MEMNNLTLEGILNNEIASILVENLTLEDIFLTFARLNKSFHSIVEDLKGYPKLWKIKFAQEFDCRKYGPRITSNQDIEKFYNQFKDYPPDTENGETTFQYLKRCIMKQKRMFTLIRDII